jgi:hypothetical protein
MRGADPGFELASFSQRVISQPEFVGQCSNGVKRVCKERFALQHVQLRGWELLQPHEELGSVDGTG